MKAKSGYNFATWGVINLFNSSGGSIQGFTISGVKYPAAILDPNFSPVTCDGKSVDPPVNEIGLPIVSESTNYAIPELLDGQTCSIKFVIAGKASTESTTIDLNELQFTFTPY